MFLVNISNDVGFDTVDEFWYQNPLQNMANTDILPWWFSLIQSRSADVCDHGVQGHHTCFQNIIIELAICH